jgi:hypothetical protein
MVSRPPKFQLSARDVAQLEAQITDDLPIGEIPYGMPLDEIFAVCPEPARYLQVAALAGHVDPSLLEAVVVGLRAHYLAYREQIEWCEDVGATGDSIGQAEGWASGYREVIVLLEGYVEELERRAADTYLSPVSYAVTTETRQLWEQLSAEAERRARRAHVRSKLANADERAVAECREASRPERLAANAPREAT